MSARSNARAVRALCLAAMSLALAMAQLGCGGPPAPTEVPEPWTSGDERALGIEEPAPAEPAHDGQSPPDGASSSGSD